VPVVKRTIVFCGLVILLGVLVRVLTGPEGLLAERAAKTSIALRARVDEFSEWADPSPVIFAADWSGPINHVNQKQTAQRSLTLYSNTPTSISVKPAANNGILTRNGGTQVLDTAYRVSGDVAAPDAYFKPAGQFFSGQNLYQVAHIPGTGAYHINVEVQMSSPPNAAPEEGTYACGITLTAGW
jgi:hypothetical protein